MHFPILPYINEHGISLMDQKAHFVDGYCPNLQVLADEDYQLLISPKQLKRADLLLACAPNFSRGDLGIGDIGIVCCENVQLASTLTGNVKINTDALTLCWPCPKQNKQRRSQV